MSGGVAVLLTLALAALAAVATLVRTARIEDRKTRAFVDHLERMGRECPACKPWGGWYLGRMREDGSYETHTCDVCGGTGELLDRVPDA